MVSRVSDVQRSDLVRIRLQLAIALGALAVSGCNCGDETVVAGDSALSTDKLIIDFGRVFVGQRKTETLVLSAPGQLPVSYGTSLSGTAGGFRAGPAVGRIGANAEIEISVFFEPQTEGSREAELTFDSDAKRNATITVQLLANAQLPPDCEDGNGCTVDEFNLETGQCEHRAERLACDDFDACTQMDTCVEGVCLGESRICDDGDVCTDDFCDARQGCIHVETQSCDDGNPCTLDICRAEGGCDNPVVDDGTPCNDNQQCTVADICVAGRCLGVNVDDGTPCDDGDPCSLKDQCVDGFCLDPTYVPPGLGDVKFATELGALSSEAHQNVILDRDDNMFVATSSGVTAIDICGEIVWENTTVGESRFGAAVSLPGLLSLPIGDRLIEIDTATGAVLREILFDDVFETTFTSSTATVTIAVEDVAVRASGALVVSVWKRTLDGTDDVLEGVIAEVDPSHTISTAFRRLGSRYASRVAVDSDEGIVAIVESGMPDDETRSSQLIRFGVGSVPGDTWSSGEVSSARTDLAIGESNEVLWSAGLLAIEKNGTPLPILPAPLDPAAVHAGAPVVSGDFVYVIVRREGMMMFAPGGTYHLLILRRSTGETIAEVDFVEPVVGMTPVVDLANNVFVLTGDAVMYGFNVDGVELFRTPLEIDTSVRLDDVALGLTSRSAVVGAAGRHAFSVQSVLPLPGTAWPRHRRDNLSTGHR